MENPNFLKKKYNLHSSPEVATAAKRTEQQTGEKLSQNPDKQIQNYLDRLERLVLDPNKEQSKKIYNIESRPRALSLLREMVMNKYIRPNKEKLAEGAARVEERVARNLGMDIEYGEGELEQRGEIAVEDLEKSLDSWISYLSDNNEPYPTWFRYYVFRNILNLGDYDKDKKEFTKRTKGSTRLFPEIDRGALAYIQQNIEAANDAQILKKLQQAQKTAANNDIPVDQLITQEKVQNFSNSSFAKQYAEGIAQAGEITSEMREKTDGDWIKYQKGTDPTALWASLQNKGTAWCTKGFATASTQLEGGDFYVYYTQDKKGQATIPRIAIRMQEGNIAEIRGVADGDQNIEGNMVDIADKKLSELPGAEQYKQKLADMKLLTEIDSKTKQDQPLNKEELKFLYEIYDKIEGFGYKTDPRIKEIRQTRNTEEDMLVVFECSSEQIAKNIDEINENTKAYVGKLEPGIFDLIQKYQIEHIYTEFPEGKIQQYNIEIGDKSKDELKNEMQAKNIYVTKWANDLLESQDFNVVKQSEKADLIRVIVKDLGFTSSTTTDEIYKRAEELGLELCPAEIGPQLRLQYQGKERINIGMKQITDSGGCPRVFYLDWDGGQLELDGAYAELSLEWALGHGCVFRLRKLET